MTSDDIYAAVVGAAHGGPPVVITNDQKKKMKKEANKKSAKKETPKKINKKNITLPSTSPVDNLKNTPQKSLSKDLPELEVEDEEFRKQTRDFIRKQLEQTTKSPNKSDSNVSKSPERNHSADSKVWNEDRSVLDDTPQMSSSPAMNAIMGNTAEKQDIEKSPLNSGHCFGLGKSAIRNNFMAKFGSKIERITASLRNSKTAKSVELAPKTGATLVTTPTQSVTSADQAASTPVVDMDKTRDLDDNKTEVDSEATDIGNPSDVESLASSSEQVGRFMAPVNVCMVSLKFELQIYLGGTITPKLGKMLLL